MGCGAACRGGHEGDGLVELGLCVVAQAEAGLVAAGDEEHPVLNAGRGGRGAWNKELLDVVEGQTVDFERGDLGGGYVDGVGNRHARDRGGGAADCVGCFVEPAFYLVQDGDLLCGGHGWQSQNDWGETHVDVVVVGAWMRV